MAGRYWSEKLVVSLFSLVILEEGFTNGKLHYGTFSCLVILVKRRKVSVLKDE
jgi:hypothetical protein